MRTSDINKFISKFSFYDWASKLSYLAKFKYVIFFYEIILHEKNANKVKGKIKKWVEGDKWRIKWNI